MQIVTALQALLKNPGKSRNARSHHGLSLDHLKLLFVVMLSGYFLGFISFLVENFLVWRENKKSNLVRRAKRKEDRDDRRKKREERLAAGENQEEEDRKFSIVSITSIASSIFSQSSARTATPAVPHVPEMEFVRQRPSSKIE